MATQFSGGTYVNATFTANNRWDFLSNLLTQLVNAGWTNVAQAPGQGLGNIGPVTISNGSPAVVNWLAHGFQGGEKIVFQTTGALPAGLSPNAIYFVVNPSSDNFQVAASLGGSAIGTSSAGSGTHTCYTQSILLESATQTNVTNPIRIRIKDNLGNCAGFSIENKAGSVAGQNSTSYGGMLLAGSGRIYQVIATRFHFLCFYTGTPLNRDFLWAGMVCVPSFLSGITDHGFLFSNTIGDSNTMGLLSPRDVPSFGIGNQNQPSVQVIWNASLLDFPGGYIGYQPNGSPDLFVTAGASSAGYLTRGYRWANDQINTSDVLFSSGLTAMGDEGKLKGSMFDTIYVGDSFAADSVDTFNGHTWQNLTNSFSGGQFGNAQVQTTFAAVRGGLWIALS